MVAAGAAGAAARREYQRQVVKREKARRLGHLQVEIVRTALADGGFTEVPVHGMLCFVEADWPLFGGSFTTRRRRRP